MILTIPGFPDSGKIPVEFSQAHRVLWNIPGTATGLPKGAPKGLQLPDGSFQQSAAATGPMHQYVFDLFALDTKLDAIQDHILAKAVSWRTFRRPQ